MRFLSPRFLRDAVVLGGVMTAASLASPNRATAQDAEPPLTAVLQTAASEGVPPGLSGAYERVVRARMDQVPTVRVSGTPPLGLSDLQLAAGCVGETDECLGAVSSQLEVQALVIPQIDAAGEDAAVVSLGFFDGRPGGGLREVARTISGERMEARVVEVAGELVSELFGIAAETSATGAGAETSGASTGDASTSTSRSRDGGGGGGSAMPWVTLGLAVAAGGVGVAFMLMAESSREERDAVQFSMPPLASEVDTWKEHDSRADRESLIATISFIGAGALAATTILLFLVTGGDDEESDVALSPVFGGDAVGVAALGRFGGVL